MSAGGQSGSQHQNGSYSGETQSDTTANPTDAWGRISGILQGNLGNQGLNPTQQGAVNSMTQWSKDQPFQTSAGIINNMLMPDASKPAYQAGAAGPVQSGNIASMIGNFQTPYTQSVVDATTNDATNALKTNMNEIAAQYGGQYGNGRSGVAMGQAVGDSTRGLATTIGNLRNQGFNTALGGATAQAGNDMTASGQNSQLEQQRNFFNVDQQNQADARKQSVLQQILGNVGSTQDANMSAWNNVYNAAGGGNNNLMSFMNSQVPAFGQTNKGSASGTSESNGGSSSKGGSMSLF